MTRIKICGVTLPDVAVRVLEWDGLKKFSGPVKRPCADLSVMEDA